MQANVIIIAYICNVYRRVYVYLCFYDFFLVGGGADLTLAIPTCTCTPLHVYHIIVIHQSFYQSFYQSISLSEGS